MAATSHDPTKSKAPLSEYVFDGSNWQDLARLVTLAKLHRQSGTEVDSEITQTTWVARQFRGPALDWAGNIVQFRHSLLEDFDAFIRELREYFGITDDLVQRHQRTQLEALKWHRDIPTFFAEFERLSHACGMGGENSGKTTLLVSKVPDKYLTILARQAPPPSTYAEYRGRLLLLWTTDPTGPGVTADKEASRPRCGKCGKKGHTANACHAAEKSG